MKKLIKRKKILRSFLKIRSPIFMPILLIVQAWFCFTPCFIKINSSLSWNLIFYSFRNHGVEWFNKRTYVFCKICKCDLNQRSYRIWTQIINSFKFKNTKIPRNARKMPLFITSNPFIAKSLNDPTKVFYKMCMLIFWTQLLNSFKNIRIQWKTRKMSSHLKKCNTENNEELCFCEIAHILKYYVSIWCYTYNYVSTYL